jgi:hypothetical protein
LFIIFSNHHLLAFAQQVVGIYRPSGVDHFSLVSNLARNKAPKLVVPALPAFC